jgi:outer membrane lipoprotein-sorting protein
MKRLASILLVLSITLIAIAQDSSQSRAILDKTHSAYMLSDGIKLSFTSAMGEAGSNDFDSQKGEAFIKGNKFRLEMEDMIIWFDGTTQWVLLKDVDEVNISNPTESELATVSPVALLSIYKEGYTLKAPVTKTVNGKSVYSIDMNPIAVNSDIKSISVAVDKTNNRLVQVILTMSNDLLTKIDITDYNDNFKYNDSEFTFNKNNHLGVEIVDLR